MSKRTRIHPVQFYLNDDEQYIFEEKYRLSRMKSKSAFLRKMILYGFVYEVDYSHIRKMNTLLGNISSNLNQITRRINSTNTVYKKDLDDIKELMEKIWQLQKSRVSKQPLIKQYSTSAIQIKQTRNYIFLPLPALPKQQLLTLNTLWITHMTAEIRTMQIKHFI